MKLFKNLPSTNTPILAVNLNQIQDNLVVVSPTEPTGNDREKVWIQKGKNLSKISGFNAVSSASGHKVKIEVEGNTTYTISATKTRIDGATISNVWLAGIGDVKAYDISGNLLANLFRDNAHHLETGSVRVDFTIITPANCDYIVVDFYNDNGDYNFNTAVTEIQIEQGSVATEYEPYIEHKIYCENDNGVYEEFYKEEASLKTQVYNGSFDNVGSSSETGVNVDFATMFPNLSLNNVICFNAEIVDVYETWDRTYANILSTNGTLQIRSYTITQHVAVRVTAFYKE